MWKKDKLTLDSQFLMTRILFFLTVRDEDFTNQCVKEYGLDRALHAVKYKNIIHVSV